MKVLLRRIIIGFFFVVSLYLILMKPLFKFERSRLLDDEIESRTSRLKSFSLEIGEPSSKESFERLHKETDHLENEYKQIVSFIDPPKARLPGEAQEAGLYFIERLHTIRKELEHKAVTRGIELPKTIGFSEDLPPSDMVRFLLRQLEMVEEAIQVLIGENVGSILLIKPLDYAYKDFYIEIPLQLSFISDTNSLVEFLVAMRNKSPVYIIKDLHIVPEPETERLKIDIILSGLVVK